MPKKPKSGKERTKPDFTPEEQHAEHSRTGRMSRAKGKRGERKVLTLLAPLWPGERRIQDRGAAKDGPDLVLELPGLHGEVKHRATTAIQMAIRDARANCQPGYTWFAVDMPTERGRPATITFDLEQFVAFQLRERARVARIAAAEALAGLDVGPSLLCLPEMPPGYDLVPPDLVPTWGVKPPAGAIIRTESMTSREQTAKEAWAHWRANASDDWRHFVAQVAAASMQLEPETTPVDGGASCES